MLSSDHEKKFTGSLMFLPHFDFRCTSVGFKEKGKMPSTGFGIIRTKTGQTWHEITLCNGVIWHVQNVEFFN